MLRCGPLWSVAVISHTHVLASCCSRLLTATLRYGRRDARLPVAMLSEIRPGFKNLTTTVNRPTCMNWVEWRLTGTSGSKNRNPPKFSYEIQCALLITRSQAVVRIADQVLPHSTFGGDVTWHHRSRNHLIVHMPFPIGSSLQRSLYLQPFSRYFALSVLGSRVWPFRVTWHHLSRDHLIAICHFVWVVLRNQASISNSFRDIQRQM